jgi:hypothetical protein
MAISDITAASYINILLTQIIQSLYYAPAAIVPIEGAVLFELTFYLLFVFDSRRHILHKFVYYKKYKSIFITVF